jgi:hypothetical protein
MKIVVQDHANLNPEKLLLILTGDGHTKLVTTNPTVILETNGTPVYVAQ